MSHAMLDVREKLIEILRKPIFPHEMVDPIEAVADYLLDSGVTVQEWVPVKERLPQEKVDCIVYYQHAYCDNDGYWEIGICFNDGEKFQINPAYKVTHWMPLPGPPKGE